MTWTYDPTDLGTSTASERLNSVRLLVGDTDSTDQQVQDEEINFSLTQTNDDVYYAASWVAGVIASKYSRLVNTELEGVLKEEYSDLAQQYRALSTQLKEDGQKFSGSALGVAAGGISITDIEAAREDSDRPTSAFRMDRFRNPPKDYYSDDYVDSE